MREIKLRYVWKRKRDNKIWIEETPIGCVEGAGDTPFIHEDQQEWDLVSRDLFIGLKDKNKKEIYEGDIVEFNYFIEGDKNVSLMVVRYDGCSFKAYSKIGLTSSLNLEVDINEGKIEVIGNIYETPELLKGGKK